MKRKIAIALMVLGALSVFLAAGLFLYNVYESEKARESAESIMQSLRQLVEQPAPEDVDPFNEEMKVVNIDDEGFIGYLSIPAFELDLPVMSTWDEARLKRSPCRHYGSVKTDNLVIAAHNYKHHFGYLGKLEVGDVVTFTDMESTVYRYRVTAVEVLPPTAVDQVKDSGYDLVLYTCTYSGSQRIVVGCSYD